MSPHYYCSDCETLVGKHEDRCDVCLVPRPRFGWLGLPAELQELGETVAGQFEIRGVLGRTRTSVIYRMTNKLTGRMLVAKVAKVGGPASAENIERERRLLTLVEGSVPRVGAGFEHGGRAGFLMEFVDGLTLKRFVEHDGVPKLDDALQISLQMAEAVASLHSAGIAHGDLTPSNIMVESMPAGLSVRIIDFDRSSGPGCERTVGAFRSDFSPPESRRCAWATQSGDAYALASNIAFLLSGRTRSDGDDYGLDAEDPRLAVIEKLSSAFIPEPRKRPSVLWIANTIRIIIRSRREESACPTQSSGPLSTRESAGVMWIDKEGRVEKRYALWSAPLAAKLSVTASTSHSRTMIVGGSDGTVGRCSILHPVVRPLFQNTMQSPVTAVALSRGGVILAATARGRMYVSDVAASVWKPIYSGEPIKMLSAHPCLNLAVSVAEMGRVRCFQIDRPKVALFDQVLPDVATCRLDHDLRVVDFRCRDGRYRLDLETLQMTKQRETTSPRRSATRLRIGWASLDAQSSAFS